MTGKSRAMHSARQWLALTSLMLTALLALGSAAPAEDVGRWECFEGLLLRRTLEANPSAAVTLNVRYTRPDKSTVDFWGFHDGGDLWRFRFMPDRLGTWRYRAEFSDRSAAVESAFQCVESKTPGLISRYEKNPIWFAYGGTRPVLLRGLHVGDRFFAANWESDKRRAFLDWAERQGYNLLSVASHYLNRDAESRGRGWQTPDLWDGAAGQPQPREYEKMEAILLELARRRIAVFPFAGFFGKHSDFPLKPEEQERYLRYTLARIGPYWNLLFNVAGPEPLLKNRAGWRDALDAADVNRLGETIQGLDVFGHLLSVHNRSGDVPPWGDWQSYVVLQGYKGKDWPQVYRGLLQNASAARPLFAQEVFWPGNVHGHAKMNDDEIRKKAYVLLMAGATINFGDMNGNSSSGFSGQLELAEKIQSRHDIVKRAWDFFETLRFHQMKPAPELVDRGFCLAAAGGRYLVYLPEGGTVNVKLPPGPFSVEWINPRDPVKRIDKGETNAGQPLTPPPGGDDWLLLLLWNKIVS